MTRRALHLKEDILDATRTLVLEHGVHSATIDAISRRSGTPVGSLYHRFGSRDRLLAEMWVRAVRRSQAAFIAAARHPEPEQAAVDAALSIYDFVRQHSADARLLASFRREDLLRHARSPRLIRELQQLNQPLEAAVTILAQRLFGRRTRRTIAQTLLAAIDIPMGTFRRYLLDASEVPEWLREPLEAAVCAVIRKVGESS
jgi:AcrR family transcriptional regulator